MPVGSWPAVTRVAATPIPRPPPPIPQIVVKGFETVAHYVVKHPVQTGIIAATTAAAALSFGLLAPEAGAVDAAVIGGSAVDAAAGSEAAIDVGANTTGIGVATALRASGVAAEDAAAQGGAAASAAQAAGRASISSALRSIGGVARQLWSIGKPVLYGLSIGEGAYLAGSGIGAGIANLGGGIQYLLTGAPPQYQPNFPNFLPVPSGPGPQATQPTQTPTASFFQSPIFGVLLIGGLVLVAYVVTKR